MQKQLSNETAHRMMDRAMEINRDCTEECRDFRIMISPMRSGTLILRWTTIKLDNIDNPVQCFHYECFNTDGASQHCSVNFQTQQEANEFFFSLETLYKQAFANDHKIQIELPFENSR